MKKYILLFLIAVCFVPAVRAQGAACIPSGNTCGATPATHWEFDSVRKICYQPFSQCGGTAFATKTACETACLIGNAITAVPTLTSSPSATAIPTKANTTVVPTVSSPSATIIPPTLTSSPSATTSPTCTKDKADINKDGKVSLQDFEIFRSEYTRGTSDKADINCDGKVSLLDFEAFRTAYTK